MKRLAFILFLFIALPHVYSQNEPAASLRDASAPTLNTTAAEIYYFHPDHLGSSAWVTDTLGHAVQHLGYLPWGERYISQKTGNFSTIYTFSGKERDEETGYSYFGQRFYDSELSFWLSADPMRGKYPSLSPFVYCANNPIRIVDPNGETIWIVGEDGAKIKYEAGMSIENQDFFTQKTIGYLNDMYETDAGKEVLNTLVASDKDYTYTNKEPSISEAASSFIDKTQTFKMKNANADNYAHETFHAYQYDLGMRGQTDTREIGALLFQALMCVQIEKWCIPSSFIGSEFFITQMNSLFYNGFDSNTYKNAVESFFNGSSNGQFYKDNLQYKKGTITDNPPIKKFLPCP